MRMKEPYEAYLDDYNCLDVYMSKNFFGGKSRIFHMKDTKNRIIPLTIQSQSDLYNGFTHYALSLNGNLEIGQEYTVYELWIHHFQLLQYSYLILEAYLL